MYVQSSYSMQKLWFTTIQTYILFLDGDRVYGRLVPLSVISYDYLAMQIYK